MKSIRNAVMIAVIALAPVLAATSAAAASYTVVSQDTLWCISQKHGISLTTLIEANPHVANPAVIWPGLVLNIPTAPAASTANYAEQVVSLVNQQRANAGLPALSTDSLLTSVAVEKARDMAVNQYFSHQSPTYGSPFDMMKTYGVRYSYAGENIAKGQRTPEEVMTAWMNSPGHRQNILSANYNKIGVGYVNGVWVQEFIYN